MKGNRNSGGEGVQKEAISEGVGGLFTVFFGFFFPGEKYKYQDINIKIYVSFSVEQLISYQIFHCYWSSKQVLLFALTIFCLWWAKHFFVFTAYV